MNEYRYYVDPYFDDLVWRFQGHPTATPGMGEAQLQGVDGWHASLLNEVEDFTLEGIAPTLELPAWVKL